MIATTMSYPVPVVEVVGYSSFLSVLTKIVMIQSLLLVAVAIKIAMRPPGRGIEAIDCELRFLQRRREQEEEQKRMDKSWDHLLLVLALYQTFCLSIYLVLI